MTEQWANLHFFNIIAVVKNPYIVTYTNIWYLFGQLIALLIFVFLSHDDII